VTVSEVHRTIEAVWRIESARVIAGIARVVRDIGIAEELAQDALVAALQQWPEAGIPQNPGAWLMAAAKHRAIDLLRRHKLAEQKHEDLGRQIEAQQSMAAADLEAAMDDTIGDDLLRLVFTACHPVLATEARVALTLRLIGGLTTEEIARAFLVAQTTVAQRIVRAKRMLAAQRVPFEVPREAELSNRLASVLDVICLIFNEGYTATAGEDWMRPALCEEALRLGRVLAELAPQEPEVHGLVALMEIQASRLRARVGPRGEPVLLLSQNRALWDQLLIRRGVAALDRAARLGGARIVELYTELARLAPSPVVELNRAVSRWHLVRRRGFRLWMPWLRSRRCGAITCSRACAATCLINSAARRRRAPNSNAPRRSRGTPASGSCYSIAPCRAGHLRSRVGASGCASQARPLRAWSAAPVTYRAHSHSAASLVYTSRARS
jgi:RNA polymerase sigma factor (sigma-70 family)